MKGTTHHVSFNQHFTGGTTIKKGITADPKNPMVISDHIPFTIISSSFHHHFTIISPSVHHHFTIISPSFHHEIMAFPRGWLRAQNPSGEIRFLPMEIQGVTVLSRTGAERQREAPTGNRGPGGENGGPGEFAMENG